MNEQLISLIRKELLVDQAGGHWIDLAAALLVLVAVAAIAVAYQVTFRCRPAPAYVRLSTVQGGVLLGKPLMNAGYWALQPLGRSLARLNVTPDSITLFGLVLSLGAGAAVIMGHPGIAGLSLLGAVLCDALDGMVARLTCRQTRSGAVFDALSDRLEEIIVFCSIAVAARASTTMVSLCVLSLVATLMNSYVSAKAEAAQVPVPNGRMRRGERSAWVIACLIGLNLVGLIGAQWRGWLQPMVVVVCLIIISFGTSVSVLQRSLALLRLLEPAEQTTLVSIRAVPNLDPAARFNSARSPAISWAVEPQIRTGDLLVRATRSEVQSR